MVGRVLAAVAVSGCAALGAEPDGAAVMREMAAAAAGAGSLSFDVRFRGVGSLTTTIPRGTAHVRFAPGEDGDPAWRYRVEGSMLVGTEGAAAPLLFGFDGHHLRALDEQAKVVAEVAGGEEDESVPHDAARPLRWLWRWDVFVSGPYGGAEEAPYEATWMGRTVLGGDECDIVRVDYSERPDVEELDLFWYVSREDHLPRRVEGTYFFGDGAGVGVAEISGYERATLVEKDAFLIEAPEGYELREAGADDAGAMAQRPAGGIDVGAPAPSWTLKNAAGEERSLEDYRGKIVLMDFWATWCGPCKVAMPGMQKIHEELSGKGVVVLGINCWDDPAAAVAYMKDQQYTYPTLLNGDQVAGEYGVSGIPTFYVVGPDGTVIHHEVGARPGGHEALRELILEHLTPDG